MSSKTIKCRAIADDVLFTIKHNGQYGYLSYGYLVYEGKEKVHNLMNRNLFNENDELQPVLDQVRPYCEACALSSCFLSFVKLYDDVKVGEVFHSVVDNPRFQVPTALLLKKLERIFGKKQIKLIEIAYEIDVNMQHDQDERGYAVATDNVGTPIQTLLKNTRLSKDEVKRAKKFGRRYAYGPKRLAGIMRNVKKNGYFKP